MEITFQKKRQQPLCDKLTVPVTNDVKKKIETIKRNQHVDVNEMTRKFWDQIIFKIESGELNQV